MHMQALKGSAGQVARVLTTTSPACRSGLFFWLIAIASLNSFAAIGVRTWAERGPGYAIFELSGISAIVWIALAASLALLASAGNQQPPSRTDWAVALLVVAASLIPIGTISSIALTILACYMLGSSRRDCALSRSGIICLAITGSLIWGRVLLALFSRPLLDVDAWLVGTLFGSRQTGNVISFVDGSGRIIVAPGCSSWQGMSLAFVFWATITQWYRVPLNWRSAGWCALALAATVAINVLRIGAMILFPEYIHEIHHGYGWHIFVWSTLIVVCTICVIGARHEIFDS